MNIKVPYLSAADIEAEANELLRSFEAKQGAIQTPETPLDEIIEIHLGLGIEITDFGDPAILGQLDVKENLVRINSDLDPYQNPRKKGRYNFTLAHECGHQVLHRPYVKEEANSILCRTDNQKPLIENQADEFASYLLMPRDKVYREFVDMTQRPKGCEINVLVVGARRDSRVMDFLFPKGSHRAPTDAEILHSWFEGLADKFHVSRQAMVIRLRRLGLLLDSEQTQHAYG